MSVGREFAGSYFLVAMWWAHRALPLPSSYLLSGNAWRSKLAVHLLCTSLQNTELRLSYIVLTSKHIPSHLRSHSRSARLDTFMFQSARARAKARTGTHVCAVGGDVCASCHISHLSSRTYHDHEITGIPLHRSPFLSSIAYPHIISRLGLVHG